MSFFLSDLASTPSLIVCVCDCSAILFQDMASFCFGGTTTKFENSFIIWLI